MAPSAAPALCSASIARRSGKCLWDRTIEERLTADNHQVRAAVRLLRLMAALAFCFVCLLAPFPWRPSNSWGFGNQGNVVALDPVRVEDRPDDVPIGRLRPDLTQDRDKKHEDKQRFVALSTAVGLAAGARSYWGPIHTLEPMGHCLKGAIDLDNPVPFTQASLGGTIVGIAASGGGSRAAYLSAAVLREIRRGGAALILGQSTEPPQSLLDQIDAMSSVSALSPLVWTKSLFTDYNRGVLARVPCPGEEYDR